jgi:TolB-like protein/class 3 adenylate cyclase
MTGRSERRLSAILAADVAGYCRHVDRDEEGTVDALRHHLGEIVPIIADHGGHVVDTAGDGVLAEFASAVRAAEAAIAIQRRMELLDADVPAGERLRFRIGINVGDVIVKGDNILGDGVNVAARLEQLAEPGSVLISGTAYDNLFGKLDVPLHFAGEQHVKNIKRPIRTYRIALGPPGRRLALPLPRLGGAAGRLAALLAATALALAAALAGWPDARAVVSRLVAGAVAPPSAVPSVAVLPFANLSDAGAGDTFARGLTDDLITDLSKISTLMVIARSSAFAVAGEALDAHRIAGELGVRYLVTGSVRRTGDSIRVNVQLADATTDQTIWAERYDRQSSQIFAVQDDVITNIVKALSVRLTEAERHQIDRLPTTNLEAYDYYVRAEQKAYDTTYRSLSDALSLYEKAIALDPAFADAYAGYARAAVDVVGSDTQPLMLSAVARQRAYDAAGRALQINPQNARAYAVLGNLQLLDGAFDQALASVETAVTLDPGGADVELDRAIVLIYAGRQPEALAAIERVLQLDPKPRTPVHDYHALSLYMNRRYDDALKALPAVPLSGCSDLGIEVRAMALARLGRLEEARAAADEMRRRAPSVSIASLAVLYVHHRVPADRDHRLDALREAGIPAWSYGFPLRPEDRLDGATLRQLTLGKTWTGRNYRGESFIMQFSPTGEFAQSVVGGGLLVGRYSIEGDLLCTSTEATMLGRKYCGPVARNPVGSFAERNQYAFPDMASLWRFSVEPD